MPEETETTEVEVVTPDVKRKFLRLTSTTFLDWPQHCVVLHALESGKTNDFAQPEDLPEAVVKKLKGFFRSGHVKVYVMTELEDGTITSEDQTPTEDDMAEDEDDLDDPEEVERFASRNPAVSVDPTGGGKAVITNKSEPGQPPPATPAAQAPATPATNPDPAAPPASGETPQS